MLNGFSQIILLGLAIFLPALSCLSNPLADPEQGRLIVSSKQTGLCLLCHSAPVEDRFQGNLAPNLALMVQNKTQEQLKQIIQDSSFLHPGTIMPAYGKTEQLQRVAKNLQGKPLLTSEQIDDVVAYLLTLQKP
jgi:sulfur-oxidizing protein SoxX